jgi:type I restriction enzyme S subunit
MKTVGDVVLGIEAGRSPKTLERTAAPHERGVLKVSAVSWGYFDHTAAKAVSAEVDLYAQHSVQSGDFLISRANTIELVGAVAIAEATHTNRFLSDKILRLVLDRKAVDPEYLLYAMRTQRARQHIQRNASGASDSMRNIGQSAILSTPIPLPAMDKQVETARAIRAQFKLANDVVCGLRQQLVDAERLPQRILAAAFGDA